MAKIKQRPDKYPLPLSFVEGGLSVLCISAGEARALRALHEDDATGELDDPDAYLDALVARVVVDEDGRPFFTEQQVSELFDPWQREVQKAVMAVYKPADPKNASAPAAA